MAKMVSEFTWKEVLRALFAAFGTDRFTARNAMESHDQALRVAIARMCVVEPNSRNVGAFFRDNQNVVMADLCLRKVRLDRNGVAIWEIETLDNSPQATTMPLNESDRP